MNLPALEDDMASSEAAPQGTCDGMLPLCGAACCRDWDINLSLAEYQSGLYQADANDSSMGDQDLLRTTAGVRNKYRMKKGIDGACIYLDDDCRCRIYEKRPGVCRAFNCQEGAGSASVFPWQCL